ncbi:MAG: PAS domain S-box protein [Acidobacteriota bacterium]
MKDADKTREQLIEELTKARLRIAAFEADGAERQRTLDALVKSEEIFRTVSAFAYDWEFWLDPEGKSLYHSDSSLRITGHEARAFLADPQLLERIVLPEDLPLFRAHRHDALRDRTSGQLLFRIVRADGEIRWIEHRCLPVFDRNGVYLGARGSNRDVTDRILAEEAVRSSEARLKDILNKCPLSILVSDTVSRRFVMANSKALDMLGYTEDELLSLGVESIHPKASLPSILHEFDRMVSGESTQSPPLPVLCKDGSLRHVIVTATLVELEGRPRVLAFLTDITELKRIEESLRESEDRFRLLVENAGDAIYLADETGRLLDVNPEAQRQTGFSREELLSLNVLDLDLNQTPESLSGFAASFRAEGKTFFETRHRHRDGSSYPVEVRVVRLDLPDRMLMLGIARDITARKLAEMELTRQKNLLSSIIESTTDAIYVKDAQGRYLMVNQETARLLGRPADQILGFKDSDMFPPEQALALRENDQAILQADAPRTFEENLTTSDGFRSYLSTKGPLMDESGSKAGLFGIARDITERKRVAEVMVQTEKMASVGGLAAGMAHEINNPLGGIMQSAQVLSMRLRPDSPANLATAQRAGFPMQAFQAYIREREIPELLDGIRDSAKRAANIVSNMIEFSEQGASAWLPVDLNGLVEKSLELCLQDFNLLERYDLKHVTIGREYESQALEAPCSANQIQQVIFNLVRNAAQAVLEAHVPNPSITLRTRRDGHCAVIEVEDNGPGMDETTRKRIFEPFFTTKGPDRGIGLGLSVSYFIVVNHHQGSIEVQSAPGNGTRFVIKLPLERVSPVDGSAGRACFPS